ncbi:MAG TPA: sigma-70 family RNA polymerase sigma factor [Gemmataceae bacterium]
MGDSQEGVLEYLHHLLGSATTPADDGRLLELFAAHRDENAFAELVARHGPLVYSLCRRVLGNAQDAEDVFQATFLVLARKAATIRKPEALSCWLHGVAYHLALKARAEAERRRILELRAAPSGDSADSELSWREVRCLLDEELQRLPEKERLPLMLCYLEGLTQDEASQRLGLPRGMLKRRLEAGRERLRLRLTRRGVTLGSSLFAVALTESFVKGVVPTALRSATVRAAMHFLTHETAAVVATPAALLAKGTLQTMLMTKLKLGTMLVLVLSCAVTAVCLALPQVPPEKQPKNKVETSAPAQPTVIGQSHKDRYGDPLPTGAKARMGTLRLRHRSMTASAAFTRDGKTVIVGDANGFVVYWDVATGREVRRLKRTPGVIYALAITSDGKTLASAARNQIYLWEIASGKLLSQVRLDNDSIIRQMLFTPDGKTLALLDEGNTIHLWDTVGNKKRHDLTGHKGNVACMAMSPDGETLATGGGEDPDIRLWDISAGKEKLHFTAHNKDESVLTLAFSPDGKTLASTGNQASFTFFDSKTGKKIRKVENYMGGLSALSYAADGKSLVGLDGDTVHILDAVSGKLLRTVQSLSGAIYAAFWPLFSPETL